MFSSHSTHYSIIYPKLADRLLQRGLAEQEVFDIDDHKIHVDEHVRYLLSDTGKHIDKVYFDRVLKHISQHKQKMEAQG